MQIDVSNKTKDEIADILREDARNVTVISSTHRASEICALFRLNGLYHFEEAVDIDNGDCRVVARKISPIPPGKPAIHGAAWRAR